MRTWYRYKPQMPSSLSHPRSPFDSQVISRSSFSSDVSTQPRLEPVRHLIYDMDDFFSSLANDCTVFQLAAFDLR
jgi:hypothetical protein